ncbi:MAG TPA: cytochrome c biogenesis protein ResB [Dehalococcoidia bacterium]|nr:cytochrome c biogenesis protein ResB [Dehalococcoidia bacterium]
MAEASRAAPRVRWSDYDPFRLLWRGFTSVRFALVLIAFLAFASFIGVIIPQVPNELRGNAAAEATWYQLQQQHFGSFGADFMDRLQLFDVFRSMWFVTGLAALVASVCVCTANRLPPIWRNVFQPQTRVPDDLYTRGDSTISVEDADASVITRELRRRHYKVTTTADGDNTYVFADRYPWAQFATFISHLALILFLAGGFVTLITAKEQQIFVAEGEAPAPVFGLTDKDHMQVYVKDAVGAFDAAGFPRDFHTDLIIYRDGKVVKTGTTSVNSPLSYGGYLFHQSAYFPDGADLQVRDVTTGNLVYDQVLALTATAATPRVVVRDAQDNVLLDDTIVPTDFLGEASGTLVHVPGDGRQFWIGARPSDAKDGWQLVIYDTSDQNGTVMLEGQKQDFSGLSFSFVGVETLPSSVVDKLPGGGDQGVAELSNGAQGQVLTVGSVDGRALTLAPNQPITVGNYQYTYTGKREFAGITVRRDPGSMFIWVATGTFLLGLALTFYTPRRRLWGKISAGKAAFRGLGGRRLAIEKEIREVAAKGGRA